MQTVLVIREADEFSRLLSSNGFEVLNLPLIETKASADLKDLDEKLKVIKNYDGIFITSRNAAQIFVEELRGSRRKFNGKVYVLGKRSFDLLKNENFDLIYHESANTAQEMLERIALDDLKGKKFLFVCGNQSLRIVPEFLKSAAEIDESVVYETRSIQIEINKINKLREKFARREIQATCFFSPSAAESFIEQFGANILHQTLIATIGKTTAEFFQRYKLKVGFIPMNSNAKDFAVELIEYLKEV